LFTLAKTISRSHNVVTFCSGLSGREMKECIPTSIQKFHKVFARKIPPVTSLLSLLRDCSKFTHLLVICDFYYSKCGDRVPPGSGAPIGFFFPGEGHRRRKGSVVGGHHHKCGARAYNGGLGAEPPAGAKRRSPPEAESILVIGCPTQPALIH